MALITLLRQETQIRSSDLYDDAIASSEASFETNPVSIEQDLNNLRSLGHLLLNNQTGNWWDGLLSPSTLEPGIPRGVNDLNDALHLVEKKRVLRDVFSFVDISVPTSQNWVVLTTGELPSQTTAAVGSGTTLGTIVAAHGGVFDSHSLSEVPGANILNPANLLEIRDGLTRDEILSDGRKVYGLLQGESGLTDGSTITDTSNTRVQISFVRVNSTGDDLESVPIADIQNEIINYSYRERVRLEDLNEYDFLKGAVVDVPPGSTVDLQTAYTNQGAVPVDVTTNSVIDLEGAGLEYCWRDNLEDKMFCLIEGSATGDSTVQVAAATDLFDVDAVDNNFLNGIKVDTGAAGTQINIGVTANQIDSGGELSILSGGGSDLNLSSALELNLTDSYRSGSTWSLTDGIALANSSAEWSDFEAAVGGEVSLLGAITTALTAAFARTKTHATVTVQTFADNDVSGPSNDANLDTDLGDLSDGVFVDDYDVYINGRLLCNGPNAAAQKDVWPGTSLSDGQIRFGDKIKVGDVLTIIKWI